MQKRFICDTPADTFEVGRQIGESIKPGDVLLLSGELGAGKTLLTKGILDALGFDVDEVTSPSFTLVNLYKTSDLNVYHVDLWRLDAGFNAAAAIGLDEILEDESAVIIVEWADRLAEHKFDRPVTQIRLEGAGDEPRTILIDKAAAGKTAS